MSTYELNISSFVTPKCVPSLSLNGVATHLSPSPEPLHALITRLNQWSHPAGAPRKHSPALSSLCRSPILAFTLLQTPPQAPSNRYQTGTSCRQHCLFIPPRLIFSSFVVLNPATPRCFPHPSPAFVLVFFLLLPKSTPFLPHFPAATSGLSCRALPPSLSTLPQRRPAPLPA